MLLAIAYVHVLYWQQYNESYISKVWIESRPSRRCLACLGVRTYERKAMSTEKANEKVIEPREIRRKLGLNQQQFWSKIGVTQSGGSRYESGRNMPRPVRELLRLVHVEQVDIQRVKKEDVEIIDYLKSEDPDLYKTLKKSAKAKKKAA